MSELQCNHVLFHIFSWSTPQYIMKPRCETSLFLVDAARLPLLLGRSTCAARRRCRFLAQQPRLKLCCGEADLRRLFGRIVRHPAIPLHTIPSRSLCRGSTGCNCFASRTVGGISTRTILSAGAEERSELEWVDCSLYSRVRCWCVVGCVCAHMHCRRNWRSTPQRSPPGQ